MNFKLKIACKNSDIFGLLLRDSEKISKYFNKSVDELDFADITDYYAKHRDEEVTIIEL